MKLFITILLLCSCFGHGQQTVLTLRLAEASRLSYDKKAQPSAITKGPLSGYTKVAEDYQDKTRGFGAVAYADLKLKEIIIAYRGTAKWQNFFADVAIGDIAIFNSPETSKGEAFEVLLITMAKTETEPELAYTIRAYLALKGLFSGQITLEETQAILGKINIDLSPSQFRTTIKTIQTLKALGKKTYKRYVNKFIVKLLGEDTVFLSKYYLSKLKKKGRNHIEYHFDKNIRLAEKFARNAVSLVEAKYRSKFKVYITGHSLGGVYAKIVGMYTQNHTEAFGSPGIKEVLQKYRPQYSDIKFKIMDHVHTDDIIPQVGKHLQPPIFYPNPIEQVYQKDMRNENKARLILQEIRNEIESKLEYWGIEEQQLQKRIRETKGRERKKLRKLSRKIDEYRKLNDMPPLKVIKTKMKKRHLLKWQVVKRSKTLLAYHAMDNYIITVKKNVNKKDKERGRK